MPASIPAEVLDLFDEPALGHMSHLDAQDRIGAPYSRRTPREIFLIEIDRARKSWASPACVRAAVAATP